MRSLLPLLFFIFCTVCFSAEYRSDGFQARISRQGVLSFLRFQGRNILNLSQLQGSYTSPPGVSKPKTRNLLMTGVRNFRERIEQSAGETILQYTGTYTDSENPDGADYHVEMRFSPDQIRIRTRVVLKQDFHSHSFLFSWQFLVPVSEMSGRGIRSVPKNGQYTDLLLPEIFETRIKLIGQAVYLAYPSVVIRFENVKNATIRFEDNRNWSKQNFHVIVHPNALWHNTPQKIPAGSVFDWTFSIALYDPPETEEE